MPKTQPFDRYAREYENWFVKNKLAYQSELEAVRSLMPRKGIGVEIGVGSGLFAAPLGVRIGVEPSPVMRKLALSRGVHVLDGCAEKLPFKQEFYDFALMITTVCFLDDVSRAFEEAHRILKTGGVFINGFIDRESRLGQQYLEHKDENVFYRYASFFSVPEMEELLTTAGFKSFAYRQTIFNSLDQIDQKEPVLEGYGKGAFVVVRAEK